MQPFFLDFEVDRSDQKINYHDLVLFIGSCFSDEMSQLFLQSGLKVAANPFGVIYHPCIISRFIRETIRKNNEERIFSREDVCLSWDANSTKHAYKEVDLQNKLSNIRLEWYEHFQKARFLFITFGTSKEFSLRDSGLVVANCHKMPGSFFNFQLTEASTIVDDWLETIALLKKINPELELVFTVSPVRHVRDGLIENNQSKSILIEAIRKICKHAACHYFPAYEIMIDQLRDHRFYKEDRIHPSQEAISYIWKKLRFAFMDEGCENLIEEVNQFNHLKNHRALFPDSHSTQALKEKVLALRANLEAKYPGIKLL